MWCVEIKLQIVRPPPPKNAPRVPGSRDARYNMYSSTVLCCCAGPLSRHGFAGSHRNGGASPRERDHVGMTSFLGKWPCAVCCGPLVPEGGRYAGARWGGVSPLHSVQSSARCTPSSRQPVALRPVHRRSSSPSPNQLSQVSVPRPKCPPAPHHPAVRGPGCRAGWTPALPALLVTSTTRADWSRG